MNSTTLSCFCSLVSDSAAIVVFAAAQKLLCVGDIEDSLSYFGTCCHSDAALSSSLPPLCWYHRWVCVSASVWSETASRSSLLLAPFLLVDWGHPGIHPARGWAFNPSWRLHWQTIRPLQWIYHRAKCCQKTCHPLTASSSEGWLEALKAE